MNRKKPDRKDEALLLLVGLVAAGEDLVERPGVRREELAEAADPGVGVEQRLQVSRTGPPEAEDHESQWFRHRYP